MHFNQKYINYSCCLSVNSLLSCDIFAVLVEVLKFLTIIKAHGLALPLASGGLSDGEITSKKIYCFNAPFYSCLTFCISGYRFTSRLCTLTITTWIIRHRLTIWTVCGRYISKHRRESIKLQYSVVGCNCFRSKLDFKRILLLHTHRTEVIVIPHNLDCTTLVTIYMCVHQYSCGSW